MSDSDYDSNRESGRGRSAGSRSTQFSSEKQPAKRRQRKPRSDLGSGILNALVTPMTVKINGVSRTMPAHEALSRSTIQELLKAPIAIKLKGLREIHKLGCAEMLSAAAKLDADRAEFDAERREFEKRQEFARRLAELSRDHDARLKAEWYAAASVLSEVRDHAEWGKGYGRLAEKVEIICRAFERDRELDAQMDEIMKELRARSQSDDGDDEAWEEEEDDGDEDNDFGDDHRDDADRHDASTDGAVEIVPGEYDESALPDTGDPNDPALDLANGQVGPEDLIPPAGDDDGED